MEYPSFLEKYFPKETIEKIREKALSLYKRNGLAFIRLTQDYKKILRGTVFWEGGIVYGYPKILRIVHLERGINRYFKDGFYVEEKVDGYNVRVAVIDGKPLAFTRGGFVCPFTTDRLADFFDLDFFNVHPEYVLCGEVVGPENPYNTEIIPYVKEDVKFFAFDILDKKGMSIAVEEKYNIFNRENILTVRHWGPFTNNDIGKVKDLILELDRDGREGIVLKPSKEGKTLKYVTPSSCLRDIAATATLMAELPAGFYIQRIFRALFFSHEFGIPLSDEYLHEAGRLLYRPNQKLIRDIDEGDSIKEFFQIRVKNRDTVEGLLSHLRMAGVRVQSVSIEKINGYYRARFYRVFHKGTKDLRRKLKGFGFFD